VTRQRDGCETAGMTYTQLIRQAQDYYRLCDKAAARGVPVALDDPRSPKTVAALRRAAA